MNESPENAVEKRNFTSFNAPPVAAEVVVIAVMEGVVNHDHSYMCEEKPEPVDMSTQTDLTGEGIEILQRQTREMKSKLADKKALMRDCFF